MWPVRPRIALLLRDLPGHRASRPPRWPLPPCTPSGMPVRYFIGLGRVLAARPPGCCPPGARPRPPADADPAVLQYFYGPATADADQAVRAACDDCRGFWDSGAGQSPVVPSAATSPGSPGRSASAARSGWPWAPRSGRPSRPAAPSSSWWPSASRPRWCGPPGPCCAAPTRPFSGSRTSGWSARTVTERVPYPGYECPRSGCARRHRDVRPGRFGIMRRRCQCGTPMNTLLLFGSSRMAAFCPHCGHPLEHRPGEAPEIVLPFFGAAGAGKTRLLFSIVTQLQVWTGRGSSPPSSPTPSPRRELDAAEHILRSGSATAKTPVQLPRAHVIRVSSGKGNRILHLFDAAGERFYHSDRTQELGLSRQGADVHPGHRPAVGRGLLGPPAAPAAGRAGPVRSTAPSPELAYQQTHQEIEAMGVQLRKARLAVVFSRADLIGTPGGDRGRMGPLRTRARQPDPFGSTASRRPASSARPR